MQPMGISGYRTKQQLAYSIIKDSIISCAFAPGSRLMIRDLAARIGVSETPVRGALTQLASEGLLEVVSHAGATVTPIRPEEMEDLHAVIGSLQGLATERATTRQTPEGLARLEALAAELEGVSGEDPYPQLSNLNRAFHRTVCEMSGSALIVSLADQLFDRLNRTRAVWTLIPGYRQQSQVEHRQILEAMRGGRAEEARRLMEGHWARTGRDFLAYMASNRGLRQPCGPSNPEHGVLLPAGQQV